MSKKRKKRHTARNLLILAVLVGAGAGFYVTYGKELLETAEETEAPAYLQETVKYGSVTVGIEESGSVSFGSREQIFTVAEITEVTSGSSAGSSGTSGGTGSGTAASDRNGTGTSGTGSTSGASSLLMSGSSASSGSGALVVAEVYVSPGQVVEEGDALLKITDESIQDYRASLEAAVTSAGLLVTQEEINVESKQAEADYNYNMYIAKGETAKATYEATITSLENAVADLEEELQESADAIEEYEAEQADGSDVEDELAEEELNYSTIEANLQIAKNNLTTQSIEAKQTYENAMTNYRYADQLYAIDTDGLEDDLNAAKETLAAAEDALAEFEGQIGDGIIYSAYTGTVMSVSYGLGDTITSGGAVAVFLDGSDVTMSVQVSQEDIAQISVGNSVSISLTAYPGETFSGEVESIATSASMGSSTVNYEVTVKFTGDVGKVYGDMTGEVTFVEKEEPDVLYVSNRAIHQDGARSWVKVLKDDGTIEEVTVKTGFSNGSKVAVLSGLEEGQTVLIESQVAG